MDKELRSSPWLRIIGIVLVLLTGCVGSSPSPKIATTPASPTPTLVNVVADRPCIKERYTRNLGCASYVDLNLDNEGDVDTFKVLARFDENRRPIRWFVTALLGVETGSLLKPLQTAPGYYPRLEGVLDEDRDGRLEVVVRYAPPGKSKNSGLAVFKVWDSEVVRVR